MIDVARFRGSIVMPDDAAYDDARHVFNERVIGRPAVVARCAGLADVRAALGLARTRDLAVAVRGGGHSVAGWSTVDDGLVIDLSPMRGIRVDPATGTAWVGGGTLAMDLILEAGEHGLAPVTGVSPKVGLGGLLLGLGEGYLTPRYGLGVDSVLALELVTADERVLQVSAEEHPELFWAMRGAGANFGVVTAMQLKLHPAPEHAVGGFITFGHDDVTRVTQHLWEIMERGSDDYFPLARYDKDEDGRLRVHVIPGHVGSAAAAEREVGALRRCATSLSDETRSLSYIDLIDEISGGGARGEDAEPPRRQVWDLYRFPFGGDAPRQMTALLEQAAKLGQLPFLGLWRTVYPATSAPPSAAPRLPGIALFLASYWHDPADDAEQLEWIRAAGAGFVHAGVVTEAANAMNHLSFVDDARVRRIYGNDVYERLASLKAEFDPENRFRRNCNIPPAR